MGIWNFLKSRPQPPAEAYAPPRTDSAADRKMDRVLLQRLIDIRALCGGTGDLIVHELEVSGVVLWCYVKAWLIQIHFQRCLRFR